MEKKLFKKKLKKKKMKKNLKVLFRQNPKKKARFQNKNLPQENSPL